MKLFRAMLLSVSAGLMFIAAPAFAADDDSKFLSGYGVVIGDSGDYYSGWDNHDTRVYAEIRDHGHYHEHYFDSLPAALFVLRERYGSPTITNIEVPEYAGGRHLDHGHEGHGLIDGLSAWYVWDSERNSRGGLPLILAFSSRAEAREFAWYGDGDVMRFEEMASRLFRWADRDRDRIYWRGWDNDRWKDNRRWNNAWNNRWADFSWDTDWGWIGIDFDFDNDRHRGRHYSKGRGHDDDHRGRGNNGRGRGNGYGRGHDNHDHDNDRRDRDRDRGRDNDRRDRDDDRREGRDNDDDDDSSSEKYRR